MTVSQAEDQLKWLIYDFRAALYKNNTIDSASWRPEIRTPGEWPIHSPSQARSGTRLHLLSVAARGIVCTVHF